MSTTSQRCTDWRDWPGPDITARKGWVCDSEQRLRAWETQVQDVFEQFFVSEGAASAPADQLCHRQSATF